MVLAELRSQLSQKCQKLPLKENLSTAFEKVQIQKSDLSR
jgi:hypothetical protein